MGFLAPKAPPQAVMEPTPAPVMSDRRVRTAGDNAERRARNRIDAADTMAEGTKRRRGGLAEAIREVVGG